MNKFGRLVAACAAVLCAFGAEAAWQPGLKGGYVSNFGKASTDYKKYPVTLSSALTYELCNKGTGMADYQTAVCWGQFKSEAKTYAFTGKFDDTVTLIIDGEIVMDSTPLGNCKQAYATVTLTEGWHDFELRCGNATGGIGGSLGGWALKYGIPDEDGEGVYNRTLTDDGNMTVFRYDDGIPSCETIRVFCGKGFAKPYSDGATSVRDVQVGDEFTVSAVEIAGDGWKDVPVGYVCRAYDAASGKWSDTQVDGETTIGWTVTETPVEFVWQWERKYDVEMTAGEGGTVSCANGWKSASGRIRATAVPNEGYAFLRWSGAVPRGLACSPVIDEPLVEKFQATAVFTDKVLYVAPGGNDDNDGSTPDLAKATIAAAVNAADDDTVVLVADGDYAHVTTTIGKRITVRGISSDSSKVKLTLASGTRAFVLQNQDAAVASMTMNKVKVAIYADTGMVYDIKFNSCTSDSTDKGPVRVVSTSADQVFTLRKCLFLNCSGNVAGTVSGDNSVGSYYFIDTQFVGSKGTWHANFAFEGNSTTCNATVDRCLFRNGNGHPSGSTLVARWVSAGTLSVRNSIVIGLGNGTPGAVVVNTKGTVQIDGVTLRGNGISDAFTLVGANSYVARSIISDSGTVDSSYVYSSCFDSADGSNGNISDDPRFAVPYVRGTAIVDDDYLADLHVLKDDSPCIDASKAPLRDVFTEVSCDLVGAMRPQAGEVGTAPILDFGCYEKLGPNSGDFRTSINPQSELTALAGEPIVLKAVLQGACHALKSAVWHVSVVRGDTTAAYDVDVSTEDALVISKPEAGVYTFSVTLENTDGEIATAVLPERVVRGVTDVYVAASNPGCAFPWNTPETASTNLQLAADMLFATDDHPACLHILPGTYNLRDMPKTSDVDGTVYGLILNRNIKAVAEGDGPAQFQYSGGRGFILNHPGALLAGVEFIPPFSVPFKMPAGTISNCVFSAGGGSTFKGRLVGCRFSGFNADSGGIVRLDGGAVMEDCTIEGMSGGTGWGTIMTENNSIDAGMRWIRNCRFCNNSGSYRTLSLEKGVTVVENCILTNNSPTVTVVLGSGNGVVLLNSLVANNGECPNGAAVYASPAKVWVTNSTVVANAGIGVSGSAVVCNSIVWDNIGGDIASATTVDHSCFAEAGNWSDADNIAEDPLFKFGTWPYRIRGNSPCRDAGLNFPGCDTLVGLDGKPRLFGRKVDMGCYESQTAGLVLFFY